MNLWPSTSSITYYLFTQFISKLISLEFNVELPYDLGLDHLVKIFSISTPAPCIIDENSDPEGMKAGRIKSINGTIIQKVLRFKDYIEDEAINNILLLSLPVTNPYSTIDLYSKDKQQSSDYIELADIIPARDLMTPEGPDDMPLLRMPSRISGLSSFALMKDTLISATSQSVKEKGKIKFSEDMYVSLDNLAYVKSNFCKYIIDLVEKNQIELIFSTETLPSSLFQQLKKEGVVVIFPVTQSEMKLLSLVLKAKVVDDIATITRDLDKSYLGNIKNYNLINQYDAEGNYQTSLIYMDKLETSTQSTYSSLGVTIVGSDEHHIIELKKYLKEILPYLYFSLTEHEFEMRECNSIARPLLSSTDIDYQLVGDFRSSLSVSVNNFRQLMVSGGKAFEFTEVTLETMTSTNCYPDLDSDFSSIIDKLFHRLCTLDGIKNVHEIKGKVEKSIANPAEYNNFNYLFNTDLDFFASLNITKNDSIMRIVQTPIYQASAPYSESDMTLNKFLHLKLNHFEDAVFRRHLDWNNKQTLFYIGDACVKVKVTQAIKVHTRSSFVKEFIRLDRHEQCQLGLTSMMLYYDINPLKGNSLAKSVNSTVLSSGKSNPKDKSGSKKVKSKPLPASSEKEGSQAAIKSYISCDVCGKVLSETMKMDGIHKNMSFLMYLYSMATKKKNMIWRKTANLNASVEIDTTNLDVDATDDFCKHREQVRVFQRGGLLVKFQRHDTLVHDLMHLSARDSLFNRNNVIIQLEKTYKLDKMQYEDKVAKEIGEYYIRQISLITFLARDLILKGNALLDRDRGSKFHYNFYSQLKFIKLFSVLCDLVSNFWFVMNNFVQAGSAATAKYNQLLRSIMLNVKLYDQTLADIHELLLGEFTHDRRSSYYADIVLKLCKMVKDYDGMIEPEFVNNKPRRTISRDFSPNKDPVLPREILPADPLLKSEFILKKSLLKQPIQTSRNSRQLHRTNTLVITEEEQLLKNTLVGGGVIQAGKAEVVEAVKVKETQTSQSRVYLIKMRLRKI